MANPSFTTSDELLEEFDDTRKALQMVDKIPEDWNRSSLISHLMEQWIQEKYDEHGRLEAWVKGEWTPDISERPE